MYLSCLGGMVLDYLRRSRFSFHNRMLYYNRDLIQETHDQKTEKVKPKLSGEKMFQQNCLGIFTIGFSGFVLV